nr:MAG TPA: hypothetical protein [Caudoviricetes sp.]
MKLKHTQQTATTRSLIQMAMTFLVYMLSMLISWLL